MSDISEVEEDFVEDLTEVEATPLEVFEDTSSPYDIFFMGNESEIETRGRVSAKNHHFTKPPVSIAKPKFRTPTTVQNFMKHYKIDKA